MAAETNPTLSTSLSLFESLYVQYTDVFRPSEKRSIKHKYHFTEKVTFISSQLEPRHLLPGAVKLNRHAWYRCPPPRRACHLDKRIKRCSDQKVHYGLDPLGLRSGMRLKVGWKVSLDFLVLLSSDVLREGRDWKKLQNEEETHFDTKHTINNHIVFTCFERHRVKFLHTSRNNKSLTRTNSLNRKFHQKTVISSFLCHLISTGHMKLLSVFYSLTMRIKWIFIKPYETNCDLWIWAQQIRLIDWLIIRLN